MSIKLNDQLPRRERTTHFTFEQSFDMGNGTTFTIWQRTAAPTRAGGGVLPERLSPQEDAQYP